MPREKKYIYISGRNHCDGKFPFGRLKSSVLKPFIFIWRMKNTFAVSVRRVSCVRRGSFSAKSNYIRRLNNNTTSPLLLQINFVALRAPIFIYKFILPRGQIAPKYIHLMDFSNLCSAPRQKMFWIRKLFARVCNFAAA